MNAGWVVGTLKAYPLWSDLFELFAPRGGGDAKAYS